MNASITLAVTEGAFRGKEYHFDSPTCCVVGRAEDCAIQLPGVFGHADVSRHHCVLDIDPPTIRVRDLGSRNGTFVNGAIIGQRSQHLLSEEMPDDVLEERELKEGDELQVGSTVFQIGIVTTSHPNDRAVMSQDNR